MPDDGTDVETIQDLVEKVLIENGHAKTAKAYILYREKRRGAREANALIGATIEMFSNYLGDNDWRVKENANAQKSINGMNNYIRETFTKQYWLHEIYPDEDPRGPPVSETCTCMTLGFFGPYCAGLGSAPASDDGLRRRARQGGIHPCQASAQLSGPDCQLHLYHPGRNRRRTGLEQL